MSLILVKKEEVNELLFEGIKRKQLLYVNTDASLPRIMTQFGAMVGYHDPGYDEKLKLENLGLNIDLTSDFTRGIFECNSLSLRVSQYKDALYVSGWNYPIYYHEDQWGFFQKKRDLGIFQISQSSLGEVVFCQNENQVKQIYITSKIGEEENEEGQTFKYDVPNETLGFTVFGKELVLITPTELLFFAFGGEEEQKPMIPKFTISMSEADIPDNPGICVWHLDSGIYVGGNFAGYGIRLWKVCL